MCSLGDPPIMSGMIRPISSSKVLLVADRRAEPAAPINVPVRRYRLARLRFEGRATAADSRFEYLKRTYD
jgi:hypothetical protein